MVSDRGLMATLLSSEGSTKSGFLRRGEARWQNGFWQKVLAHNIRNEWVVFVT